MANEYGWTNPNQNPQTNEQPVIQVPDEVLPQILKLRPDWQVDGFGLRGPQPERPKPQNARPFPMDFGIPAPGQLTDGKGIPLLVADESTGDFSEGETLVSNVEKITYDNRYFKIHDNGGGEVQVSLITTDCSA